MAHRASLLWPWSRLRNQQGISVSGRNDPNASSRCSKSLGVDLSELLLRHAEYRFCAASRFLSPIQITCLRICIGPISIPLKHSHSGVWRSKPVKLEVVNGWIYYPHPETKERHWQPPTTLELLAPRLSGVEPGCTISFRDQRRRIKLVDTIRLRARLLEFLKFRVLASQQTFFEADTLLKRQQWLSTMFPEALQLSEQDLDRVWSQARSLYTEF